MNKIYFFICCILLSGCRENSHITNGIREFPPLMEGYQAIQVIGRKVDKGTIKGIQGYPKNTSFSLVVDDKKYFFNNIEKKHIVLWLFMMKMENSPHM